MANKGKLIPISKQFRYWLIALLTGLLLSALVSIGKLGYAQDSQMQRPTTAVFDHVQGTVMVYPNGNVAQRKTPDEYPIMKSDNNDQLWVAGSPISLAHMKFVMEGQAIDPAVSVGGVETSTLYRFPCRMEELGSSVFGWGFNTMSACDTVVIRVGNDEESIARKLYSQQDLFEDENTSQIAITRLEDVTLIRVYKSNGDVFVDVLVGAAQVIALSGQEFTVNSGNRFVQSGELENLEPMDLQEAANSQMIEGFLDEANWSLEVEPLLDELKANLADIQEFSIALTDDEQTILDVHNDCREEVNVPPLSWSVELASIAQDWADTLSGESGIRHSPGISGSGAGENIAAGSSIERMLDLWKDEKEDYDTSTGQCRPGRVCGHYTQMVWQDTTEVGCGIAPHRRYGNVMVCNYRPPGNFIGQRPY